MERSDSFAELLLRTEVHGGKAKWKPFSNRNRGATELIFAFLYRPYVVELNADIVLKSIHPVLCS
jgi:hypothetical protein